jgi:hypothetical protein
MYLLYDVVKIWSGCDLNIYILYVSVMSLSRLHSDFFKINYDMITQKK